MTRIRLLTLISAVTLVTATFAAPPPARAHDRHDSPRALSAATYSFSYGYGPYNYHYYYSAAGGRHRYRHNAHAYHYPRGAHYRWGGGFHPRRFEHGQRRFHSSRFGNPHFNRHRFESRHNRNHRFSRHYSF